MAGAKERLYGGSPKKKRFLLLVALLLLTTIGVFDHNLLDFNEIAVAEMGREFLDHHNWSIPTLNNQPFLEKPPLVYWTVAISFKIFGVSDWVARIPTLLFAWGTFVFTYLLAKILYSRRPEFCEVASISCFVLGTSIGFFVVSRSILTDIGLCFFTTGALYFLYRAFTGRGIWYAMVYLFMLGAFFSKGFVGFAIPILGFFVWVLWNRKWGEIIRSRFWIYIPLISIPIILWFISLANYPGENLKTFLINNNFYRFFPVSREYRGGHEEPFYYYFIWLPAVFFPWIIFLVIGARDIWHQRRDPSLKFLLSCTSGLLFFFLAGTKREIYLIPFLPVLAIMITWWFFERKKEKLAIILSSTTGVILLLLVLLFMPIINEKYTIRILYNKLAQQVDSKTQLYGFRTQEVVDAATPFYLGRYFKSISKEEDLARIAKEETSKRVVVILLDEHSNKKRSEIVKKYFPYTILAGDVPMRRKMWVFSNLSR